MAEHLIYYLSLGAVLGLSAGFSPGPLMTLVLTQTLRHNRKEGVKVALSPLITDVPIILLCFFLISRLAQFDAVLALISFAGALFVAYLAWDAFNTKGIEQVLPTRHKSDAIKKGILTNALSPHPYLFWLTVGTPIMLKALDTSTTTLIAFLASFYFCLIGAKVLLAFLVARSKAFIKPDTYRIIMRILGLALLAFAVLFVVEGLKYLR